MCPITTLLLIAHPSQRTVLTIPAPTLERITQPLFATLISEKCPSDSDIWLYPILIELLSESFSFFSSVTLRVPPLDPIVFASVRGSHGLSGIRARWTELTCPKGKNPARRGRQLEVGAQRAPRLLVFNIFSLAEWATVDKFIWVEVHWESQRSLIERPLKSVESTEPEFNIDNSTLTPKH